MLIIPSIDLVNGRCSRCIVGAPGTEELYQEMSWRPFELAQLYRRENAKCVHVTDMDSWARNDNTANIEAVMRMRQSVDIPIEFVSLQHSVQIYRDLLKAGVYRVALNVVAITEPEAVRELIDEYTSSRVIFGVRAHNGDVDFGGDVEMMTDEEYIQHVYELGGRRLIYTETDWEGALTGEDLATIRRIAGLTPMRITMAGGIATPQQLWELQANVPRNVDSLVIGRALYENRFPCQFIWRQAEAKLEPEIHAHACEELEQSSISQLV